MLSRLAVAVLVAVTSPMSHAGFLGGGPKVFISSIDVLFRVDSYSFSQSLESSANEDGTAQFGPCNFRAQTGVTGHLEIETNWMGSISAPRGRASGSSSCRLDFDVTILDEGVFPAEMGIFYELATGVSFDPSSEVAHYGWTVASSLWTSDGQRGFQFGEIDRQLICDTASDSYSCSNFFDYNFAPYYGFRAGDKASGSLVIDLFFDLRSVPEPSTLAILGLSLAGLALTRRRKR